MTGYGKAGCTFRNLKIIVEIRSLNSKGLDLNIKLHGTFKDKENLIRNALNTSLERGKIDFLLSVENGGAGAETLINKGQLRHYYDEVSEIARQLNMDITEHTLAALLRLPDVLQSKEDEITSDEWEIVEKAIIEAIDSLTQYRISEGRHLQDDITNRLQIIERLLHETEQFEVNRIQIIRQRIIKSLKAIAESITVDENRLEQELISLWGARTKSAASASV